MIKKTNQLLWGVIITLTIFFMLIIGIYTISFFLEPPPLLSDQNTVILDHSVQKVSELSGTENRSWVHLEEIAPEVIDAVLAIEDNHFYSHNGFDLKGILRATWKNLKNFSLKEGASTITQQYARNLFLTHEKTWTRKIKEAFYTVRLEMYYSKDEILEGYLNVIYFGHGAYGIESASQFYFAKSAKHLSLPEAAMLVAIPKGPTYYSPVNHLENAKNRQKSVLKNLREQKKISASQYDDAVQKELHYEQKNISKTKPTGNYFFATVLRETGEILQESEQSIRSGGYEIHTSYDAETQRNLQQAIEEQMDADTDLQVAAITMDPFTGAIQGLIGGTSYDQSPFNRAVLAKRMPGSTFKPFLYYAALENNYTATTTLLSKPTAFILENDEVYQPRNFNGYYADKPITLAQALALSDNIYAVKTNLYLGSDTLKETAQRFGITSELPAVPSLALGTASVSLQEMVTAYGMLANGGDKIQGHTVTKIVNRHGKVIYERNYDQLTSVLDENYTFLLTNLLMGMFDESLNGYTTVTGAAIMNELTHSYAGKSGTTPFDSWMIGYSPHLVSGIWTGYDDHRAMEIVKEVGYAKGIWAQFMEKTHQNRPAKYFSIPEGVTGVPIDPETGKIATPYCPNYRTMYFIKGTEPESYCSVHFPTNEAEKEFKQPNEKSDQGFFYRLFERFMKD